MSYEFETSWPYLTKNGFLLSDDIIENNAFHDFYSTNELTPVLIKDKKDQWMFAGIVILSANAGGAWSPIGDVTTIMLWIGGQVTASNIIISIIIPFVNELPTRPVEPPRAQTGVFVFFANRIVFFMSSTVFGNTTSFGLFENALESSE